MLTLAVLNHSSSYIVLNSKTSVETWRDRWMHLDFQTAFRLHPVEQEKLGSVYMFTVRNPYESDVAICIRKIN